MTILFFSFITVAIIVALAVTGTTVAGGWPCRAEILKVEGATRTRRYLVRFHRALCPWPSKPSWFRIEDRVYNEATGLEAPPTTTAAVHAAVRAYLWSNHES